MKVLIPIDHANSTRNRCVIEPFGGVFKFNAVTVALIMVVDMLVQVLLSSVWVICLPFSSPSHRVINSICQERPAYHLIAARRIYIVCCNRQGDVYIQIM